MTDELINYYINGNISSAYQIVKDLLSTDINDVCKCVSLIEQKEVNSHNIPQYSNYDKGTVEMLKYLRMAGDFGPSFTEIGEHFLESGHKPEAYIKYGENHSKLAELLGIVVIKKQDRKRVYLSEIGREIEKLDVNEQYDCFVKLSARIPIVQEAIKLGINNQTDLENHLKRYLSYTTAVRRRKNTWVLIEKLQGCDKNGV